MLIPVPTAVPPIGNSASASLGQFQTSDAVLDLARVTGEFLAQANRHRVLKMRAADLDDLVERLRLVVEFVTQVAQRGNQPLLDRLIRRDVDRGRDHVVRRLTHVDRVVGMDRDFAPAHSREHLVGEAGDNLVGVHVCRRAAAGLENIDDELIVRFTVGDELRRANDRLAKFGRKRSRFIFTWAAAFLIKPIADEPAEIATGRFGNSIPPAAFALRNRRRSALPSTPSNLFPPASSSRRSLRSRRVRQVLEDAHSSLVAHLRGLDAPYKKTKISSGSQKFISFIFHLGLVEDVVAVALLGKEELAMVGEFHLAGVAGDERVKNAQGRPSLGRKTRPRRWASSWRLPKVPETWIITLASGRSIAKLPTFDKTSRRFPRAKLAVEFLADRVGGLAGDQRDVESFGEPAQLVEILTDDQNSIVVGVVAPSKESTTSSLAGFSLETRNLSRQSATAYSIRA